MLELQTRSISKSIFILSWIFILSSCHQVDTPLVQDTVKNHPHVLSDLLQLKAGEGIVYFKNKPFTGYAVSIYNKDLFSEKTQYQEGVKQGKNQKWFKDGTLSFDSNYQNGKLHGTISSWWKNGNKRSESNYENGIAEGGQMQWYKSGQKFKRINLKNGKEQGIQQSWRENGKLYNNYEAKNGRTFGIKRASLCFQLDDEKIQLSSN